VQRQPSLANKVSGGPKRRICKTVGIDFSPCFFSLWIGIELDTLIIGFNSLTTHYCPPLVECFLHSCECDKPLYSTLLTVWEISKNSNIHLTQTYTAALYLGIIELFAKATSNQSLYRALTSPLYDCSSTSNASSVHNSCWCVCLAPLTLINNSRGSTVTFKRLPFHQYESTIKY